MTFILNEICTSSELRNEVYKVCIRHLYIRKMISVPVSYTVYTVTPNHMTTLLSRGDVNHQHS